MCRPPPSSPLFPYTTLFRSDREIGAGGVTAGLGEVPLRDTRGLGPAGGAAGSGAGGVRVGRRSGRAVVVVVRSEEHTSELQSHVNLVCRLLLDKKKHTRPAS